MDDDWQLLSHLSALWTQGTPRSPAVLLTVLLCRVSLSVATLKTSWFFRGNSLIFPFHCSSSTLVGGSHGGSRHCHEWLCLLSSPGWLYRSVRNPSRELGPESHGNNWMIKETPESPVRDRRATCEGPLLAHALFCIWFLQVFLRESRSSHVDCSWKSSL